jgi:hypothetical protein
LLFFNIGVEIGQIAFVIATVGLSLAFCALLPKLRATTFVDMLSIIQRPSAYIVGTLAMYWTFERVSSYVA